MNKRIEYEIEAKKRIINTVYNIMDAIEKNTPFWLMLDLNEDEGKLEITTNANDVSVIYSWFKIIQDVLCKGGIKDYILSAKGIVRHDYNPYSVFMIDCNPVGIRERNIVIGSMKSDEKSENKDDWYEEKNIEKAFEELIKMEFEEINVKELHIVDQELIAAYKAFTEHGCEFKIIKNVWNCYSPYFKGKKKDAEKVLSDERIKHYKAVNLLDNNEIISFKLVNGFDNFFDRALLLEIIKDYPDLVVTCILTGDPEFHILSIAVAFSKSGCPYFTDGTIVGSDGTDGLFTMSEFEDLFEDYNYETSWEDPHTGEEWEIEINYKYPYLDMWNNSFQDF